MSKADDIFLRQFGVILGLLVLFGIAMFFLARAIGGEAFREMQNSPGAVAERIAPVGQVRVGDPSETVAAAEPAPEPAAQPAAATSTSGADVYQSVCSACHVAGVAGAPKLDDAQAWKTRYDQQGMDGLVASVVNGKGAMPAKGGNPSLDENAIRAAVSYMLEESGVARADAQASAGAAAEEATRAASAAAEQVAKAAGQAMEETKEAAGEAMAAAGEKAKEVATEASAAAESMTASAAGGAAGADAGAGESVYGKACVACHAAGVAGAPKLGDAVAWEPRVGQGFDGLVASVLEGKGAMPPKGGNMSLSEEDIRNAVAYMLEETGLSP